MWTGGAASASAESDDLTTLHEVSLLYFELGKMQVEGEQSLAVVDDDEAAFVIKRACKQYCPAVHGGDGRSGGDAEVEPLMRALCLAVEDALRAENVGDGGVGGSGKVAGPFAIGRDAV